ncbi:hypothetical protein TNCV_3070401 [Trichonephila clavipes]|nr:hypothetical protein TNCV_3070401 [Trichonephila clavipes]
MNMKRLSRKENFQMLPKELHQEKYEAISAPQDKHRPIEKTKPEKVQHGICCVIIKHVEEEGYFRDDVYNVEETGVNWKDQSRKSMASKRESTAPGFKVSMERVTTMRQLWSGTNNRVLFFSPTAEKENQRPCSEKTKVNDELGSKSLRDLMQGSLEFKLVETSMQYLALIAANGDSFNETGFAETYPEKVSPRPIRIEMVNKALREGNNFLAFWWAL